MPSWGEEKSWPNSIINTFAGSCRGWSASWISNSGSVVAIFMREKNRKIKNKKNTTENATQSLCLYPKENTHFINIYYLYVPTVHFTVNHAVFVPVRAARSYFLIIRYRYISDYILYLWWEGERHYEEHIVFKIYWTKPFTNIDVLSNTCLTIHLYFYNFSKFQVNSQ